MKRNMVMIFAIMLLSLMLHAENIIPVRTDVTGFSSWSDTNVVGTTYLRLLVAGANTVTPAMNFNNYTSETLGFTARTYGGVNAVENTVTVSISTNNGVNWTDIGTRTPTSSELQPMTPFDLSSYNGTQVKIRFSVAGTNNGVGIGIDDITIAGTPAGASISATPNTLASFSYIYGNGPAIERSFTLIGTGLTSNLSVTVSSDYEISSSSGGTFGTSLSYTPSGGGVNATVYVRLVAGLAIGSSYTGTVTCSSTGAADATVSLSGSVTTPPAPTAPNANEGSSISSSGFTANWDIVSGATGYAIDVYTKTAGVYATDLIISEYVEGSNSNKYLEIYNGTGSDVDLSNYYLRLFSNGASTPTNDVQLSGTLSHGSAVVYRDGSAALTLPDGVTAVTNAAVNFNGDDAVALYNTITSAYVDIFGMIGQDPGAAWSDGTITTVDKTLVRKSTVVQGVSVNPTGYAADDQTAFETLGAEWDMYDQNTVSFLGSHTMAGGGSLEYVTGYHNLDVGNVTTYNVTGLDPETTYYYVVRAYDVYDQSSPNSNEISVTTTAAPASVVINADGTATGAAIVSGGSIPESLLGADSGAPAVVYTITSTGVKDVTVYKTAAFAGDWYCWLNTPGGLIAGANPIQAANFYIFEDVNFDAKGDVVVIINDNSTLPVELSSFTATLSAQNLVSLMWITQSETGVSGYYIYRGIDTNASTAQIVSPLITATNTSTTQSYVYVDSEIFETGTYYYWLQNVDIDGTTDFHGPIRLDYVAGQNNGTPNIPVVTELKNVYPNPFNPIAFISYSLTENNPVAIKIYNNRGQLVRVLDNAPATAGNHRIEWNGMDNSGNACSTGLYLVRMTAGNKTFTQKVVLVK